MQHFDPDVARGRFRGERGPSRAEDDLADTERKAWRNAGQPQGKKAVLS